MSKHIIKLTVHLDYDEEAEVWYVAKSDIPGLSLEASTAPELIERINLAAPELVQLNARMMPQVANALGRPVEDNSCPWALLPVFDKPLALAC